MSNIPTPLTDAVCVDIDVGDGMGAYPCEGGDWVPESHARQLERALRILAEKVSIYCEQDECCPRRNKAGRMSVDAANADCIDCQIEKAMEKARSEQ